MASVHYGRLVGESGFAKTVAIKRLLRELVRVDSFRKMILEEGRLAARVRHPNVVPPLDVLAEGGELLLVMEYVHGESLSRLLRAAWAAGERVPLPVGVAILANVLHGLHAAHEARDEAGNPLDIVHRDISPQNVIVGVDGIARVIDFGIAKAATSEEMTTAGTIKGKVPYLAPEQLDGEPATRRTDLYAAAVVFWEVLAGRRLFEGADDGETLRMIMSMEVKPPSVFNPLVAGTVDDVVLRAISRDPKARFASARDMALALEGAVHLATSTVVGAWVERLAAEALAERAERIREVEGAPPSASPSLGDPAAPKPSSPPPPKQTSPPPKPSSQQSSPPPKPSIPPPLPEAVTRTVAIPPPPAPGAPRITIPPPGKQAPPPPRAPSGGPLRPPPPPPASTAPPPQPMRPPAASRPVMEQRTVIYEPPPMPAPDFIEGVRPLSRDAPLPSPPTAPREGPPPAGALRKPELEIRNVKWAATPEAKPKAGSAFKRFLRYLAAFLVFALIVAWMFGPAIARAWIVTGAASRGIVLTIDRVDVSRRAIRLVDVRAESVDLPGATMRAGTMVIGLRWLVAEQVTFDDAEVALEGSYGTMTARVDQYRAKHGAAWGEALAGVTKIEVTSGRIEWKDVLGTATSARVENITADVTKNRARRLGDDYHLTAPLFTMHLAGAPAGPWQLDIDRQGTLARSVVRLDPTGSSSASVTRTAGDDGTATVALAIPLTSLSDLHLPPALLGGLATARTRVEAHGELSIVAVQQTTTRGADASTVPVDAGRAAGGRGDAGRADAGRIDAVTSDAGAPALAAALRSRSVSGHIVLAAGSLTVFTSGPLVDLSLDLPFAAGDVARPFPVAAALAVGPADPTGGASTATASAPMNGTLDLSGPTARLELLGTTGPIPCVKAAAVAGAGAGGRAAGVTALRGSIALTLDDLPQAQVTFVPMGACTPKLR